MSKFSSILLLVVTFSVGGGLSRICRNAISFEDGESQGDGHRSLERVNRPVISQRGGAGRGELAEGYSAQVRALCNLRYGDANYYKRDSELSIEGLSDDETAYVLDDFHRRSGVSGLERNEKSSLSTMLKHWFDLAPDAALSWLSKLENDSDRVKFSIDLMEPLAKRNLDEAITWSKAYLINADGDVVIHQSFMKLAVAESESKFLDVVKLSVSNSKRRGASGVNLSNVDFPAGFDFGAVMNDLADHLASYDDRMNYQAIPQNMLREWAARDPQAAYDWLETGKKLKWNDSVSQYVAGFATVATADELGVYSADGFDAEAPSYVDLSEAVYHGDAIPVFESFLSHVDQSIAFESHLTGLLNKLLRGGGNQKVIDEILGFTPADQRMKILNDERLGGNIKSFTHRHPIREKLLALGHSQEEVDREFPLDVEK